MKNIIKTDNYLLIVSDEIPTTWYYDTYLNKLKHTGGAEYGESSISKKVIGHLPLNNSPILEGVDLLPPLEDEVEKLANEYFSDTNLKQSSYEEGLHIGYKSGYNKAKEKYAQLIEKQISDFTHDLRESTSNYIKQNCEGALFGLKRLKQSLQQTKYPIGFECEMVNIPVTIYPKYDPTKHSEIPKTTTNSQGQTVLVGKYIYE